MDIKQLNILLLTSSEFAASNTAMLSKLTGAEITETVLDTSDNGIQIPRQGETACDAVLICGNPCPKLQMYQYVPAVYLKLTGEDIKKCCTGYSCDAVAVVISGTSYYGFTREGENLNYFIIEQYGSYMSAVDTALAEGFRVVAAFETCRKYVLGCGLEFIPLEPGIGSMEASAGIINAELAAIIRSNYFDAVMDAMLNVSFSGIISVDKMGMVTGINDKAQFLLNCRNKLIKHEYVMNIFQGLDKDMLESALDEGVSVNSYHTAHGAYAYDINIEPVFEKEMPVGAVIAFNASQKEEKRSITEAINNGLTANHRFSDFLYLSDSFNYVLKKAKLAAYSDNPVLLVGEDGTELEHFAQCIHNESDREKNGYIEIECNAWDAYHIEQMLFGNAMGGNGSKVQNAVEMAEGGTIFINHIDMLPQNIQYNIYQLISGWYTPANDVRRLRADVRIIAATNNNLKELVMQDRFREDLYYALNVLYISIPPLRDRKEDVADIAGYFINKYSKEYNKYISMARGGLECIKNHNWSGNTAELKSFCKKLVITTPRRNISEAFVRSIIDEGVAGRRETASPGKTAAAQQYDGETIKIIEALKRNRGNRINTAAELGISKTTLWRKMQKLGITEDYKC